MSSQEITDALWVLLIIAVAAILVAIARGCEPEVITVATPELSPSGVPEDVTKILVGYFADAQAAMREMVLHPKGLTQGGREFRQARAAAQGTQVDAILARLKRQTADWAGGDQTFLRAVHDARVLADRQVTEAGVRVEESIEGRFDVIDERTASVFARDAAADLYGAADSMGARGKRLLKATAQQGLSEADINKILAGGAIAGTPADTIRRLRDELRAVHGGTVTIKNKNGDPMEFDVRKYAALVARTKTREATQVARHERLADLGLDLVAIVGRQSASFCTAFLGQVFSLSGKHPKYPAFASLPGGGPPFHPNCSKSTRPFVEALAGDRQKADAKLLPDAGKLLGQDVAEAQRRYKDLQLRAQVKERYADTESKLYPAA